MWELDNRKRWALRTDAFELWYWRRLSRVPWIARRSNQSILKEINPEYSLEWLMQKLQCFCHLMQRADSLEKILMLERLKVGEGNEVGGDRGWDGWMAWIWTMDMSLSKFWEMMKDREVWYDTIHGVTKSQTWLSNWTKTKNPYKKRKIWARQRYTVVCYETREAETGVMHVQPMR